MFPKEAYHPTLHILSFAFLIFQGLEREWVPDSNCGAVRLHPSRVEAVVIADEQGGTPCANGDDAFFGQHGGHCLSHEPRSVGETHQELKFA